MTADRIQKLNQLCKEYQNKRIEALNEGVEIDDYFDSLKKYIALEVIDAYKSGELK